MAKHPAPPVMAWLRKYRNRKETRGLRRFDVYKANVSTDVDALGEYIGRITLSDGSMIITISDDEMSDDDESYDDVSDDDVSDDSTNNDSTIITISNDTTRNDSTSNDSTSSDTTPNDSTSIDSTSGDSMGDDNKGDVVADEHLGSQDTPKADSGSQNQSDHPDPRSPQVENPIESLEDVIRHNAGGRFDDVQDNPRDIEAEAIDLVMDQMLWEWLAKWCPCTIKERVTDLTREGDEARAYAMVEIFEMY
ncbi:hypothetical protein GGR54DRAFT_639780 [Hypoxylon sp. NC1633]|nr:hypothetical protein GGR54DRAFT_639780 [Hypoxylon sp. NC1633]